MELLSKHLLSTKVNTFLLILTLSLSVSVSASQNTVLIGPKYEFPYILSVYDNNYSGKWHSTTKPDDFTNSTGLFQIKIYKPLNSIEEEATIEITIQDGEYTDKQLLIECVEDNNSLQSNFQNSDSLQLMGKCIISRKTSIFTLSVVES